jgi:hypothetical protein
MNVKNGDKEFIKQECDKKGDSTIAFTRLREEVTRS